MYMLFSGNKLKKRIVVEVSSRFHADIKRRAALKKISMKTYILNVLIEHLRSVYESDTVQHISAGKLPK